MIGVLQPGDSDSSIHSRRGVHWQRFGAKFMKTPSILSLILVLTLVVGFTATTAQAATIHADGIVCTLANAILAANTDSATGGCPQGDFGADTIVLDADVTLDAVDGLSTVHGGVGAGLPDVTDDLTIMAGLGHVVRRDPALTCNAMTGDPVFRFVNLEAGSLTLEGLSFEQGCFVGAGATDEGGGLRAAASTELTLDRVTVSHFQAFSTVGSLDGGFLFSIGQRLTVLRSEFDTISVDAAVSLQGGAISVESTDTTASIQTATFSNLVAKTGSSVQGGALYSRADLTVDDTIFTDLIVESGSSLQGGAIYASSSPMRFLRSRFQQIAATTNSSLQGGALYGSGDNLALADVIFSGIHSISGNACSGGALYSNSPGPFERLIIERSSCRSLTSSVEGGGGRFVGSPAVLRDCTFRQNEGHADLTGRGGAVFATAIERLERCAFIDNRMLSTGSVEARDARGGGLSTGRVDRMRNVTFAYNTARGADGALLGVDGGSGQGGGLYLSSSIGHSVLSSVTFTGNQAMAGDGAVGFFDGEATGGGLFAATGHSVEVVGSIFADNTVTDAFNITTPEDCAADGTLTSLGYNLAKHPDSSCSFTAFGDITSLDPGLYPVADYGCSTTLPDGSCVPAAAIDHTSWAIDWGSCADAGVAEDARGLTRRQDIVGVSNLVSDACDVGAFEARDRDGDGITDVPDLCPNHADSDQSDGDGDQVGDACDACHGDDATGDADSDRVCDDSDVCPGFDDRVDGDGDSVPDGCDACLGDDASGDADGDLVCDDSDVCPGSDDAMDGDGDGVPDGCDVCAGDDAAGDSDGDGVCDDADATLGDRVWFDDGNGVQDGGEPGVRDVTVHLFSSTGVLLESTSTDAEGHYAFSPGPGSFYLEFVLPPGMAFAPRDQGLNDAVDSDVHVGSGTTSIFSLAPREIDASLDVGLEPAVIGHRVWNDTNADGRQQPQEPGLVGVTVRLLDTADQEVAVTTTGTDGIYGFAGIATGDYRIEVVLPMNSVFVSQDIGGDDLIDSDVDPTGRSELFRYTAGSALRRWDAGVELLSIFEDNFESGSLSSWSDRVP